MNVKVNLNYPIYDGAEIVFRAPCDAYQVTGLIVDYLGGTQKFAFADAHTNDLGNIDYLFSAGAVVKVILDIDTGRAFVQNAATNAYLESRFKAISGGLRQPTWGFEAKTLLQVQHNGRSGFYVAMSEREYNNLMAQCVKAIVVWDDGQEFDIDLSRISYSKYDIDSSEFVPCLYFNVLGDPEENENSTLLLLGEPVYHKIPAEYIDLGNIPSGGGSTEEAVRVMMETLIELGLVGGIADADGSVLAESDGTILCDI